MIDKIKILYIEIIERLSVDEQKELIDNLKDNLDFNKGRDGGDYVYMSQKHKHGCSESLKFISI